MKCHRARELASEALDGALAAALADEFRAHLSECPPCRSFHTELRESLALLSELPEIPVDDRFEEAVWSRLRESPRRRAGAWDVVRGWGGRVAAIGEWSGFGAAWRWAPLGAAAALLAVFALSSGPGFDADAARAGAAGGSPAVEVAEVSYAPRAVDPEAGETESIGGTGLGDETAAAMPQAIEAYLRNTSRDLRLETDGERLRRSNYSYPIRRVGSWGEVRKGPIGGTTPTSVQVRPVSDPGAAVIAF